MGDLPYMPLFVDDFEADTPHLTLEEDGVYNRLLRLCWRNSQCSLPDDPEWIARRMRVDMEAYHRLVAPIIREFFTKDKGRIFQGRQRREWKRVREMSDKRAEAGKKGGQSYKPLEMQETAASRASFLLKQNGSTHSQAIAISKPISKIARLEGKILWILGRGEAVPKTGPWADLPSHVERWQTEFSLEDDEVVETVAAVVARGSWPKTPAYLDHAMHDVAMRKMGISRPFRKGGTE